MNLVCDQTVAAGYTSRAQIARRVSEYWVTRNMFCLACCSDVLRTTPANTKCKDFLCADCSYPYELKTFLSRPPRRLIDGAYESMMSSIISGSTPILLLLHRGTDWKLHALSAVHPLFLTREVIEKRKPLSANARRAGWVGCNIRLDHLPAGAEIPIVQDGICRDKQAIRQQFARFVPLRQIALPERGWTALTLTIVHSLGSRIFTLADLYEREASFASSFPANHNVRPKIRQQLQRLRDLNILRFKSSGQYELLDA